MEALTPASAGDLPPIGELVADDLFWRYLAGSLRREGVAHLQVWTTATVPPGDLAVVTETGHTGSVTESAGEIWAELPAVTGRPWCCSSTALRPSSARVLRLSIWTCIWPTAEENPRHAQLELWMANYGYQIVSRPASWFDSCEGEGG